jgi:hypothetical protein
MSDRVNRFFRIWVFLAPSGALLVLTSSVHFLLRIVNPVVFVLPNDPAAWFMLLTGILLIVAGLSRSFKARVIQLVRQSLEWIKRRRRGQH